MCLNGRRYFITFIDDYSRYMYLFLLYDKCKTLDVEKQLGKQIKIVKSDRSGKYYGMYTKRGQLSGPFARFLQEHGIVAQYTMPSSPSQNGMAKKRTKP